jgi:crossover junction endodeoxyribonuclease RuvC
VAHRLEVDVIGVAGIDPATKNLAIALPDGTLVTLNARAKADAPVRRLHELEQAVTKAFRLHPPIPDIVIVEGYGLGSPGRLALVRLGEVGGMVRTACFRMAAEVVEVAPGQLKRFATGNGAAKKDPMVAAARAHGARPANHDEADAYHLARLGRMAYGLEQATEDYEREILAAIKWPVVREVERFSIP